MIQLIDRLAWAGVLCGYEGARAPLQTDNQSSHPAILNPSCYFNAMQYQRTVDGPEAVVREHGLEARVDAEAPLVLRDALECL